MTRKMWNHIEKLSELRSGYSCFNEEEEPYYHALSLGIEGIKALEQDSILDKIKAEIAMYEADCRLSGDEEPCKQCTDNVFGSIYRIIDKYKAESEQ